MTPEYFHHHLTFYEADDYLAGLHSRAHTAWECARWQTTFIAKCAGNKNYKAPEFEWERKHTTSAPPITADELAALKAQGAQWAATLNKQHGKS